MTAAAAAVILAAAARRTWVGAPWMDAVSDNPLDMNLVPSMKRKKGKKKDAAAGKPMDVLPPVTEGQCLDLSNNRYC